MRAGDAPTGHLDRAIADALRYLHGAVPPDGEVPVDVASRPNLEGAIRDGTTFGAALALPGLCRCGGRRAAALRRRVAGFLERARNPDGTWHFWTRRVYRPVDADTDATAVAAASLRLARAADPSTDAPPRPAEALDEATERALLGVRDDRGRFRTWVRRADAPNDVDLVVNANVLFWFGDHPDARAAADWVAFAARDAPRSGYYPEVAMVDHAIARALHAGATRLSPLADRLVARAHDRARDPRMGAVERALTTATLGYLGEDARAAAGALIALQAPDGGWDAGVVWTGPEAPAPPSVFWGSRALTTALALEALTLVEPT